MFLELVIRMPVMCAKNNSKPKEVANGTLGHVIGYQLPQNVITHHQVIDESFGYTILVSSTLSEVIFVKLLGHDQVLNPELLPDIISIHPILERDVFIRLPNRSFIFLLNKFPSSLFLFSQLTNAKD